MSTQGRSSTRTDPPEMVASASITGRRKVITPDERAPIEIELKVVSAAEGVPNPSAALSLQLNPAASPDPAMPQRLIQELKRWVVELEGELQRRPGEPVHLQMDLERTVNG
jgi:hypothetical protein